MNYEIEKIANEILSPVEDAVLIEKIADEILSPIEKTAGVMDVVKNISRFEKGPTVMDKAQAYGEKLYSKAEHLNRHPHEAEMLAEKTMNDAKKKAKSIRNKTVAGLAGTVAAGSAVGSAVGTASANLATHGHHHKKADEREDMIQKIAEEIITSALEE